VLLRTPQGVYRPICDFRGNVLALLDESGDIVESYRYDGFGRMGVFDGTGEELTSGTAVGNPFGFACKRYDPTTALFHFGARWYDPALGRFISPDPLGFVDGPNPYAYCAGDPVNFVDPWGLRAGPSALEKLRALWALTRVIQTAQSVSRPAGALDGLRAQLYDEFVADPVRQLRESIQTFREDPSLPNALYLYRATEQAVSILVAPWPQLGRYQGPKPTYTENPAHVPGPTLRPGKTPLPADARAVFRNAVPNDANSPTAWFGRNSQGRIYRFSVDRNGSAHFSGIDGVGDGTRNLTTYARKRLGEQ